MDRRKIVQSAALFIAGVFTAIDVLSAILNADGRLTEMILVPVTVAVFSFVAGLNAREPDTTNATTLASIVAAQVQRVVQESLQTAPTIGTHDAASLSAVISGLSGRVARLENEVHQSLCKEVAR